MIVLFVHGMGISPISGWLILRRLRQVGMEPTTFGYSSTFESFSSIKTRLIARISTIAAAGDYIVVGHSLGGILLRAALSSLPEGTIRPHHIFLLGSPIHSSHLANQLKENLIFRAITGDCGQLLSSTEQMNAIGSCGEPTTCIVGVGGPKNHWGFFGTEANDGLVSVSEASATWLPNPIEVPLIHTFLPSSKKVAAIIIEKSLRMRANIRISE